MRAIAVDRFGDADELSIHEVPVPKIGANEVLIRIHTTGVGIWDVKARKGAWGNREFPFIPGVDGSGVVAAAGSRVRHVEAGDRVYAYSYDNPRGGFHAEYVAVPGNTVSRLPKSLDLRTAGAIATIALTAQQGVDDALKVTRKERVLIHGASGNVGMLAIQFAKLRGALVLASASGKDGIRLARRLGADEAIDGREDDIDDAAREFAPKGIDAVLAFAGGKDLTRCIDTLLKGGRVAWPNGVEPAPRKRKGVRMKSYDATPGVREFQRLNRAIDQMEFRVPIAGKFKLADAADAHRLLERGHVLGKVILRVS
jgi:NADPH:quinone reductase-like Zn-dependent oxidoreductase